MQGVAQGLLMYKLTKSAFWLGLDGFMATVPGLFLTLVGGVFADIIDRRRLLLLTQVGAGLSAFILACLVVMDKVHPVEILILTFVTGCCMSLAGPSYQALTVELVGREDLANAIALNSTQFQLSRVIGPALAGAALDVIGVAGCFFANAFSYLAVLGALLLVKFEHKGSSEHPRLKSKRPGMFLKDLKAGLAYVRRRPRIFWFLIITASTSLLGAPYLTMMPVFAHDVFNLGDTGLAVLMGGDRRNARTCDEHVHPFIHWRNAVRKSYCWCRLSYIRRPAYARHNGCHTVLHSSYSCHQKQTPLGRDIDLTTEKYGTKT